MINTYLIAAAFCSAAAALLHIVCIFKGPSWYRLLGAGEHMAIMAEQGLKKPTIVTAFIALILFTWAIYALAVAGIGITLPLQKTILALITTIYLLRAGAGYLLIAKPLGRSKLFWFISSSICTGIGVLHLLGLQQSNLFQ